MNLHLPPGDDVNDEVIASRVIRQCAVEIVAQLDGCPIGQAPPSRVMRVLLTAYASTIAGLVLRSGLPLETACEGVAVDMLGIVASLRELPDPPPAETLQ
jgi:hypothetical protein